MRLVSFAPGDESSGSSATPTPGPTRTGLLVGDEIVDLTHAAVGLPPAMPDLLAAGPQAMERAAAAPATAAGRHPLATVTLMAPVPLPPKVMGLGMNYGAHVAEMGRPRPDHQVWFNKQRTCVIAPEEAIAIPVASPQVDYEGELAFVIGRRCRHVSAAEAPTVVAGFTIMNDVSVRDWQWRTPTWTMGKSFDTHGPLGPWLVTPDEIEDPHRLGIRTWVNDDLRQDSSTDDMIFSCWDMVEELSTVFTLEPGDVVSTGTPAGVGAGFDPPKWLVAGDRVRIEVEGLGVLENPVVDETRPARS